MRWGFQHCYVAFVAFIVSTLISSHRDVFLNVRSTDTRRGGWGGVECALAGGIRSVKTAKSIPWTSSTIC